jgi:hypothetical protein
MFRYLNEIAHPSKTSKPKLCFISSFGSHTGNESKQQNKSFPQRRRGPLISSLCIGRKVNC